MDEEALIQKAKNGDVNSYNRLVLHYQQAVYNVAYRIMGEPQCGRRCDTRGIYFGVQGAESISRRQFQVLVDAHCDKCLLR